MKSLYTGFVSASLILISIGANGAPVDYCNELDLNPDLSQGNKRIFVNPHSLGCDLGFSLPGLGNLSLGKKLCDKIESKTNGLLDSTFGKLDAELNKINNSASNEFSKIKGMDFSGGDSGSSSGSNSYDPANFQTTIDGQTYRVDITEEEYQSAINQNALQQSIDALKKRGGTPVKLIPNKIPAAGPSVNPTQSSHSGYFD